MNKLDSLHENNPKLFWNLLNSMKSEDNDEDNSCISGKVWTDHFSKLYSVPNNKMQRINEIKQLLEQCSLPDSNICLDREVCKNEIVEACKKLKNGKSCGFDGILNEMIKYGQYDLLPCIEKLFNLILTTGYYPKVWSQGILVPLYKAADRMDPNNYRGITITSSLGKLFNSILNTRLEKFLNENRIIHDEQIGFRAGSRTSDHIFKLKTLLYKYLKENGKLFTCFIDLRKAFDSVVHPALFYKLYKIGIGGRFIQLIQSMYKNNVLRVKVDNNKLSDEFTATVGVRQGDNLSPNLFNIFINDMVDVFDRDLCDPVKLGSANFNCLLYAYDVVLISQSAKGLQNCLNMFGNYCQSWCLDINYNKSKVLVFNRTGRLVKYNFSISDVSLEVVREYKYLGIVFTISGKFSKAVSDLYCRGQKAYFKLMNIFKYSSPKISTVIHTFDHTVKPILLYASEIWNTFDTKKFTRFSNCCIEQIFKDLHIEKLNIQLCKFILGVNKKASNQAVMGELGRYPLYIDAIVLMIKYWFHLHTVDCSKDMLLSEALKENYSMFENDNNCWLHCIYLIFKEVNMVNVFNNPFLLNKSTLYCLKRKLRQRFENKWLSDISSSKSKSSDVNSGNKLRTYATFKRNFACESYV
ncbi:MAG: reverse transcriptase family protein, partial [Candidatus Thiodiazotropha sp.]